MVRCARCGAEITARESGIVVCSKCWALSNTPANPHIHSQLVLSLADATLRADAASEDFMKVMTAVPSGMPHSDGVQRLQNVSRELTAARKEMMPITALMTF